ncbi:MAG: hypothetical protein Q7J30_01375 [Candidatus Azambacteria bacterium]|nr:hypothetical protein [Candidatus Azambacteria bacterium]
MKKTNIKNNEYILMSAALLLLGLSGFTAWFLDKNNSASQPKLPAIIGMAVLTIDFGDGSKRSFEGEIVAGETSLDALAQASKAGNFSYKMNGNNELIAIENVAQKKNKRWRWYLDDKKIDRPLNEIVLKSGDKMLTRYE